MDERQVNGITAFPFVQSVLYGFRQKPEALRVILKIFLRVVVEPGLKFRLRIANQVVKKPLAQTSVKCSSSRCLLTLTLSRRIRVLYS